MPFRELREQLDEQVGTIAATQAARNHMEHIAERITEGRRSQREFSEMARATFQAAIGRLEFPNIEFGTEAFNLDGISSAVLSVGLRYSDAFNELFKSGIEEFNTVLVEVAKGSG